MSFGYVKAQAQIERLAIAGLALSPDGRLSGQALEGMWKERPVVLQARSWSGPRTAVFRTVRLTGAGVEIVNVFGAARSPLDAPILGIDLVAARADAGVVVADLSPLEPPAVASPLLPEWAQGIFSAAPLVERVTPATAGAALMRVIALVSSFVERVNQAADCADIAARHAALDRYRAAHFKDDRMRTMLEHMFGAERAAALMADVLFPEFEAADVHA